MRTGVPRALLEVHFEAYAQEYLRKLKPEHFMEAIPQATQRKITVESLDLVTARRPDVQVFNELLVQYPIRGRKKPGQVVPDNMVVVSDEPIKASGHFTLELQPVAPFWVMEYVSNSSKRKDYVENMKKYEEQLKVPYYLLFYPDNQELSLFRHNGVKYVSVLPDDNGRHAIAELEMAVALVDGWVRYYFRDELLRLPGDLQSALDQAAKRAEEAEQRTEQADRRAKQDRQLAEQAEQRAKQDRQLAEEAEQRAEEADRRAEQERQRAQHERQSMADQIAAIQAELTALRGSSGPAS